MEKNPTYFFKVSRIACTGEMRSTAGQSLLTNSKRLEDLLS